MDRLVQLFHRSLMSMSPRCVVIRQLLARAWREGSLLAALLLGVPVCGHVLHVGTVNEREYLAYLPEDYAERSEPMLVLLALHPATFDAEGFRTMAQFEQESAAEDVIVIYANGSEGVASVLSWDAADPLGGRRGDAEYLLAVVADIATVAPTHEKFAITGFSAGALMTYRMLCEHSERIVAAVPYGAYYNESVIELSDWPHTVPLLHMHGADDPKVNPLTGEGEADHLYNFGVLAEYMSAVALRNSGSVAVSPDMLPVESVLSGASVTQVNTASYYVLLEGIGHYWPRAYFGNGPNGAAAVLAFINQFVSDTSISPSYVEWLLKYPNLEGGDALREADPDGDRLPNLLEMLMGLDPLHSDLGSARYPQTSIMEDQLRIRFAIDTDYQNQSEETVITFYGLTNTRLEGSWTRVPAVWQGDGYYTVEIPVTAEPVRFLKLAADDAGEAL